MSNTFITIIREVAEQIGHAEGKWVSRGTIASGTTTTLVDTTQLEDDTTDADATQYVNAWARLWDNSGTTVYDRRITTYTPSSGTLTWAGAAMTPEAGVDTYTLHYLCHPDLVENSINKTLRLNRYRTYHLLTQVVDGDMEDSTADPPNWTESASQTLSKSTTAAKIMFGVRSLRIQQNSQAITEYVASDAIPVAQDENWAVKAYVKCDTGGATIMAYDNTNGAEIDSWDADETGFTEIGDTFSIPSGCEALVFRLYCAGVSDDVYWDSVWAAKRGRVIFDLPSWITERNQVRGVFYLPAGGSLTGDMREIWTRRPQPVSHYSVLMDETGATPNRIEVDCNLARPIFLDCDRPYAELSEDTDTTTMDKDTLVAGALMHIYKSKGEDYKERYEHWRDEYNDLKTGAGENRPSVEIVSAYSAGYRR